ncbi:CCAAT/enhancer-binding protein zeta-like [Amphibalanus amphitrite]|uniref:CCAAT/enhancer-binding protein zeta-like n=1 Tax=Amphibalanus amphitrite TaxID=1232801 RepID=UPI001C924B11|nr:CCAAT/enhancer-binding protein zeta-like [Amphibalanus amphitrite]XP_043228807.1 CCAAT/enhancer-binding protein zeta-like [Amphibalanus amphitrite]XP_043228808.1 CCAAT/enhancer-binding protein zeta-like [Amphibalanus amphitrite]XP_043228809.1 CCAAT/enhancer-binding protein zeta-like [Amphibalanus amphitrite]XP_043228811.1 CCAAT/enhancer-binding protein zeta-like [Amphibalanus amphitrite]
MDDLQGEVKDFVSQLGFEKFSNIHIASDDDSPSDKPVKSAQKRKQVKQKERKSKPADGAPTGSDKKQARHTPDTKKGKGHHTPDGDKGKGQHTPDGGKGKGRCATTGATKQSSDRPADGSESSPSTPKESRKARKRKAGRRSQQTDGDAAVQVDQISSSTADDTGSPPPVPAASAGASSGVTKWYQNSVTEDADAAPVPPPAAGALLQEASAALAQAVKAFKADGGGGQSGWTQTVLTSGTVSDKLAARQALLASRPLVALHLIEDTVRMVAAKGKGHAMQAMQMLANSFGAHLLPPGRKLKLFKQQPLGALQRISGGDPAIRRRQLMLWLFEERLKSVYADFVGRVREMSHDTLEKTRKHGVNTLSQLLVAHPELEQRLLEVLVNKLGDEKKSVACLAVRRLGALLRAHPAMRTVVVKEVERLLFRQNVGKRVQFYGVTFLSQVQFSDEGDEALAQRIVKIYVGFFRACVKQAELDARLMRALLTGLSGCVGRARLVGEQLQQYVHPLHHIAQLANFGVATQALLLMFRLTTAGGQTEPTDRYYSTLYKKLVHPGLATSQKVADFLNLVYRSIRLDPCEPRARAFIKRLLQACLHQTAALACSVLLLVSELLKRRPELARLSGLPAPPAESWSDRPDGEAEDDEEAPRDVPLSDEERGGDEDGPAAVPPPPAGWQFVATGGATAAGRERRRYDPLYREPRWCRAERAALHELAPLARHLHPTLALFAGQLLTGQKPTYTGNPLHDFQLMHFLNRFCYKNPKASARSGAEEARRLPVNAAGYARLPTSQVPHDERFFHKYFSWRAEKLGTADPAPRITDESGDVTDEAFDSFLDGFFGKKADGVDFLAEMADGGAEPGSEDEEGDGDQLASGSDDDDELDLGEDDDDDEMEEDSLGEDEDDDEEFAVPAKKFKSSSMAGKRKGGKGDVSDLFASADDFSELLEEGVEASEAAEKASKTNRHQLQWEESGSGKRRRQGSGKIDRRGKHKAKRAGSARGRRSK